jgi:hypothetical protein
MQLPNEFHKQKNFFFKNYKKSIWRKKNLCYICKNNTPLAKIRSTKNETNFTKYSSSSALYIVLREGFFVAYSQPPFLNQETGFFYDNIIFKTKTT